MTSTLQRMPTWMSATAQGRRPSALGTLHFPPEVGDASQYDAHQRHPRYRCCAGEFGTEDRRLAYRILRAWLYALGDRLPVPIAANFAAQLQELLRGVFYDGWSPSRVPVKLGPGE